MDSWGHSVCLALKKSVEQFKTDFLNKLGFPWDQLDSEGEGEKRMRSGHA